MKLLFWRWYKKFIKDNSSKIFEEGRIKEVEELYQTALKRIVQLTQQRIGLLNNNRIYQDSIIEWNRKCEDLKAEIEKIKRAQTEADLLLATLKIAFNIISGKPENNTLAQIDESKRLWNLLQAQRQNMYPPQYVPNSLNLFGSLGNLFGK